MKYSAAIAIASVAVGVQAQGAPSNLTPSTPAPSGCVSTGSGTYEVTVVKPAAAKRDLQKRAECGGEGTLIVTLTNGILTDSRGRIGSIVANRQFQFDGPPAQTGAIYTAGWSICPNSSIAIGGTTDFFQCLSGSFYNLYDQSTGNQCSPVKLDVIPCGSNTAAAGSTATGSIIASQAGDGQPTATSAASVASQQSDGQPTAPVATTASSSVVSQISDGQPQASSAVVSQISDGQPQATTAVVSQISDGQPQATGASNGTLTTASPSAPIATGGASSFVASGAAVFGIAAAALFL